MSIGFDFGTASCSVAQVVNGQVMPIPLTADEMFISSTLCAPSSAAVSEYLYRHLDIRPQTEAGETLVRNSIHINRQEKLEVSVNDLQFGEAATSMYLQDPTESYYVKSPKSFLGLLGLGEMRYAVFEDLICAMMANVKLKAETVLDRVITEVVIGRPINFYNRGGEESNQQAIGILKRAAVRAGFKHVEFQFEPVAAGLEYESTISKNRNVLVVDIGGGTSDCSLIQMGPRWVGKHSRFETLLGHAGIFTGGNDLDIHLANMNFMAEFGKGSYFKSKLPIPNMPFWGAIAINDVVAQKRFYSSSNYAQLSLMHRDAVSPKVIDRLMQVHENTLGYSIVAEAEKIKIALSSADKAIASINLPAETVSIPVSAAQMEEAVEVPVEKISKLIKETIAQAAVAPDVVFITGGTSRSPVIRKAVEAVVGSTPIENGDYFGSVTSGLARWAKLYYG